MDREQYYELLQDAIETIYKLKKHDGAIWFSRDRFLDQCERMLDYETLRIETTNIINRSDNGQA